MKERFRTQILSELNKHPQVTSQTLRLNIHVYGGYSGYIQLGEHTVLFRENFLLPLESSASLDYRVEERHLKGERVHRKQDVYVYGRKQTSCDVSVKTATRNFQQAAHVLVQTVTGKKRTFSSNEFLTQGFSYHIISFLCIIKSKMTKSNTVLFKDLCPVCVCVCVPQPAAAPVAPVPSGLGVSGCPGTLPASGTWAHTGSGSLSSTQLSPSPGTKYTGTNKPGP